jgi:fibronectin type 3 domain-containing protein
MGNGEITREAANSIVRPPRKVTATPSDTRLAHSVTLNWNPPVFGQIVSYNIYRGANGTTPTLYFSTSSSQTPAATSYTDATVTDCTTYTYFVTSLLGDGRESVASNSVTYFDPCPPQNLGGTFTANQVSLAWGAPASGAVAAYNVYRAVGPTPPAASFTLIASAVAGTSYTDTSAFTNNTTYSYVVTDLLQDTTGCPPNQNCRESSGSNVASVLVHFQVTPNVIWPTASAISLGQSLQASKLSGGSATYNGALVDGSFAFTNPAIVPPIAGSYSASVTFTPKDTYDYNSVIGNVLVPVNKGATTTTITSIVANPNPPVLGQTITVNFTVSPAAATGSVTVTEDSGATCTGKLTNGTGSCNLTLNVLTATGKSAVGSRTLTATYPGDSNYAQSSTAYAQQVVYRFVGFKTPLALAGTYSGTMNLSRAIPIQWQLTNSSATTYLTMSNLNANGAGTPDLLILAIFNGQPPANGKCPVSLVPAAGASPISLFSPVNGVTGNSSFRYDSSTNTFAFNWDTTVNLGPGCYTLTLILDDAVSQPLQLASRPTWATSMQLR